MRHAVRRLRLAVCIAVAIAAMLVFASSAFAASTYYDKTPAANSTISQTMPLIQVKVSDPAGISTGFQLKVDGVTRTPKVTWGPGNAYCMLTYQVVTPLKNGVHTVYASVFTGAGRTSNTWSFSIAAPPTLGPLAPADGSTASVQSPTISVGVNTNGSNLASYAMVVDGASVFATYDSMTKTISYVPGTPLRNDATHSVAVSVTDAAGVSALVSWSFDVQIYADMSDTAGCTDCHTAFPASHPITNCPACHAPDAPMAAWWNTEDTTPVHGVEHVTQYDCTYCHADVFPSVPKHGALPANGHYTTTDMSGCACHVRSLTVEHNRYQEGAITCAACHTSTDPNVVAAFASGSTACPSCHPDYTSKHGYSVDTHSANNTPVAGTWPSPGDNLTYNPAYVFSTQCSDCHTMELGPQHGGVCGNCHPSPRDTFTTWDKTCTQSGCHTVAGTAHDTVGASHPMSAAEVDAGCGFTNPTNGRRPCHYRDLVQEHNRTINLRLNPVTGTPEVKTIAVGCKTCHDSAAFDGLAGAWDGTCNDCHDGTTLVNHSIVGTARYDAVYAKHNNPSGYYDNGATNSGFNAMDAHGPIRVNPDAGSANKTIGCGAPTCHTVAYLGGGWPWYTTACSACHGPNVAVPDPYQGDYAWYSDYWFDDEGMDTRLTMTLDPITLPAASVLQFKTWYDIEKDWDYGYVQVSTDNGATWTNQPMSITTNTNPWGANQGNGITGSSGGWVDGYADLSAYAGQTVKIRFAYIADFYTYGLGWMLDTISVGPPGAPVFTDDIETARPEWDVTTSVTYYDYDLEEYVTSPTNLTGWKRFTR